MTKLGRFELWYFRAIIWGMALKLTYDWFYS